MNNEHNIISGDGVELSGPVSERDTSTPPSNHDHDENGEDTTSRLFVELLYQSFT